MGSGGVVSLSLDLGIITKASSSGMSSGVLPVASYDLTGVLASVFTTSSAKFNGILFRWCLFRAGSLPSSLTLAEFLRVIPFG